MLTFTDRGTSLVMFRSEAHEWTVELRQGGRLTFGQSYRTRRAAASAVRRIMEMRRRI